MWGTDNHWFRADINPGPERGFGWGTQFEAILTYALTDQWTVGAGARYWYFIAPNSIAQFPGIATNSPILFSSERYGGFLQASYKFGAPSTSAAAAYNTTQAPVAWTGIYTGGSFGAGFGRTNWSDPFGPTSIGDQDRVAGALAGGQIGANYQFGVLVYGLEAAGSWTQISGTATCFAGNPNQGIAGQNCASNLGALAAFTGRVGYAVARTLYYVKAGPAFGHSTFGLNFGGAEPGVSTITSNNRWGWTVGAGIEQALTEKWSIVGEYKYIDLGSSTVRFAGVPGDIAEVASERINQRYQAVTLGLNYKLN
jgi:opacity protein-like surface antigen